MVEIIIDLTKSLRENASDYFDKAKKLEQKIKRAEKLLESGKVKKQSKKLKKIEWDKKWYEQFKWSFTSQNKLILIGRDAHMNQILVRNHLKDNDLFFHADIHGAPTIVLKNGQQASDMEIEETASIAAAHSKAWKEKLGYVNIFYAKPEQVSLSPKPGEYLPKGGVIIRGQRGWIRGVKLSLAIGVADKIYVGVERMVSKKCKYWVTVKPGYIKKSKFIKEITKTFEKFGFELDPTELDRLLPSGGFEFGKRRSK